MKVVINRCYGGFGLSNKAVERCIELGMTVSRSKDKKDTDFVIISRKNSRVPEYYCENESSKEFRSNPIVVQAVEELGKDSWGYCASLEIVEIPFNSCNGWYIHYYDGIESVHEEHESW